EPEGDSIRERLNNAHLVAPLLLRYELANAASKKVRRHGWLRDEALVVLHDALALPIQYEDVDNLAAARLALDTGLSAYDASYLWLTETLGLELVALDGPLARAYSSRR